MRRTAGVVLSLAGLLIAGVGVLGPALGWREETAQRSAAQKPGRAATPVETAETLEVFVPRWQAAFRSGDTAFLVSRLHPAVVELYGEATCRASLANATDPTWTFTVQTTERPGTYLYIADDHSTAITEAITVTAELVTKSATSTREFHLASVEGRIHWFRDCGEPLRPTNASGPGG